MPLWRRGLLAVGALLWVAYASASDGGVADLLHGLAIPEAATIASALAARGITDTDTFLLLDMDVLRQDFPSINVGARLKIMKYIKDQQSATSSDCVSEDKVRALIAEEGGRHAASARPRELQSGGAPPDGVTGASAWFKADAAKVVFGSNADCALERKHPGDLVSNCPVHASGGIKIGANAHASCSSASHGGFVRWNPSEKKLELCNGEEWGAVGSGSGTFAAADGETCDETKGGALQWDEDKSDLSYCTGSNGSWKSLASKGVASCRALLEAGETSSGTYNIDPLGNGDVSVYCDMTTFGGGWTFAGRSGSTDPRTNGDYMLSQKATNPATNHGPWHFSTEMIMAMVGGPGSVYELFIQDIQQGFTTCTELVLMKMGPNEDFTFLQPMNSNEVHTGSSYASGYEGPWNPPYTGPQAQNPKCLTKQSSLPTAAVQSSNLHWRFNDSNGHGRNGCCGSNTAGNLLLFVRPAA